MTWAERLSLLRQRLMRGYWRGSGPRPWHSVPEKAPREGITKTFPPVSARLRLKGRYYPIPGVSPRPFRKTAKVSTTKSPKEGFAGMSPNFI